MTFRLADTAGYYPRARCRFLVRLEDFGQAGTPEPPKRIPTLRKGSKDVGKPGSLQVTTQDGRFVLVAPGTNTAAQIGGPQDQTTSLDDLTHVIDGVVPLSASWEVNGVYNADALTLTLNLEDFPFDPRVIRSLAVKYFLGCITAEEADRGASGEFRESTGNGAVLPFGTIPDSFVDARGRLRTNERFLGFVDTDRMVLDSNAATVQMDCTDNTSLFIAQEHPTQLYVSPKRPLDEAIAQYLTSFPQFVGMSVEYRPHVDVSKKPILGPSMSKTGAQGGKGPPQGAGQKVSVWDYLTEICGIVGHVLRVEGTSLIIQRPRTLYGDGFRRDDDPFVGRSIEGNGEPPLVLPVRMYGYGANAMTMSIGRSYTKAAPKSIEVRSYDTARKKSLYVRFPEAGQRPKNMKPGQTGTDLKFEVVRVAGITDVATLKIVAQAHYEAKNRNEFDVQVETTNLGSFGGSNLDPDVLDVREGDAIQLQILRDDSPDGPGRVANLAFATVEELVALGFRRELAEAYVDRRSQIALPTTFRVREMKTEWSGADSSVKVAMNLINYVVASISKPLPDGEEILPSEQLPGPDVVNVDDVVA